MVQLQQHKRVVRQPADEERCHKCSHDFEGFGGFGHPVGAKFEDDDGVADDDDDKRHNKSCNETTHCNCFVTVPVRSVIVIANGSTQMIANLTIDHRGEAESDGKNPGNQNNNGSLLNCAMVLRPNWEHYWHETVHTDNNQEEDAAEHVEKHNRGHKLAHEAAKDPLLQRHAGDAEGEEGAEDKVRDGKAQVPGGVYSLLHLEARNPDDNSISTEAQQKNDNADDK